MERETVRWRQRDEERDKAEEKLKRWTGSDRGRQRSREMERK